MTKRYHFTPEFIAQLMEPVDLTSTEHAFARVVTISQDFDRVQAWRIEVILDTTDDDHKFVTHTVHECGDSDEAFDLVYVLTRHMRGVLKLMGGATRPPRGVGRLGEPSGDSWM